MSPETGATLFCDCDSFWVAEKSAAVMEPAAVVYEEGEGFKEEFAFGSRD